jgi:hypothetical protein
MQLRGRGRAPPQWSGRGAAAVERAGRAPASAGYPSSASWL